MQPSAEPGGPTLRAGPHDSADSRYPNGALLGLLILFATAYGLLICLSVAGILWSMNKPRRKTLGVTLALGGAADPADLEMVAEEVTFNLSDGSPSPGWIIEGRAADGPAAVVVHGHRDSRFGSLYRAEMLQRYCRAIAVFDLPAHGDAGGRCLMGGREADDVRAVAEGLPDTFSGGRPLVLLGYSMGATIVVKAAAKYPQLVADGGGVIACAPYRRWDEGLRGQLKKRGFPAWPLVAAVGGVLRLSSMINRPLGERPGFDRAADAANIAEPLLVLHGDADRVCPLSAGRAIADAAPRGELVVIPGGTHNQLLRADYNRVHAALAAFFKKLGKSV